MTRLKEKDPCILPVEIGFYGRPISRLNREQLLDAIIELSRMYMELDMKFKNYQRKDMKRKNAIV